MRTEIIDAHAHCGRQDRNPPQTLEAYLCAIRRSGIVGAVMFPPVIEIYDRYDFAFEDDDYWRKRRKEANRYLPDLEVPGFRIIPFYFIWNDFAVEEITTAHRGIKWHRHGDEPEYRYDDPRCRAAIEEIRRRNMPVCLEEEWRHTVRFIDDMASGVRIIIPHFGLLNGGYESFRREGIWDRANIFTDTSLVPGGLIEDYVNRYGHDRIMFGSDFPFGDPGYELGKILGLKLPEGVKQAIAGGNVTRLISGGG